MAIKGKSDLSDTQLSEVARVFSTLAEPSRLKLLRALMQRSMTVSELIEATGMRQGNVSKHLSVLSAAGFVGREPEGNFVRYSLTDPTVLNLCGLMCARVEDHARKKLQALR
jgi:DNA-binding transcriptional ArsR family regulator